MDLCHCLNPFPVKLSPWDAEVCIICHMPYDEAAWKKDPRVISARQASEKRTAALDALVDFICLGNDLEEWCEIRVRKDLIPKGASLVEAYLTEKEIVVMGQPKEDDESHNCDAMGCGTLSHVLYRLPLPNEKADAL